MDDLWLMIMLHRYVLVHWASIIILLVSIGIAIGKYSFYPFVVGLAIAVVIALFVEAFWVK